jgi:MerR family redox-sensitive transcriptional activator SoxR
MRIGEVARQTGLKVSAIRFYESEGLLPRAARSGGMRMYDSRAIERLQLIAAAQRYGFRLGEIREMLRVTEGKMPQGGWRQWIVDKVAEIDANVARMTYARRLLMKSLVCECRDLETCAKTCEWIETPARAPKFNANTLPD